MQTDKCSVGQFRANGQSSEHLFTKRRGSKNAESNRGKMWLLKEPRKCKHLFKIESRSEQQRSWAFDLEHLHIAARSPVMDPQQGDTVGEDDIDRGEILVPGFWVTVWHHQFAASRHQHGIVNRSRQDREGVSHWPASVVYARSQVQIRPHSVFSLIHARRSGSSKDRGIHRHPC